MESCRLTPIKLEQIPILHHWYTAETRMDLYTCRPAHRPGPIEEYVEKWKKNLTNLSMKHFLFFQDGEPVGKISLFDYNPRNRSAEFGFYLPEENRQKGIGTRMTKAFLETAFRDKTLDLNKLYATTSFGNAASNRLLRKFGFSLEGRMREHYWIDGQKYDQMVYSLLRIEWKKSNGGI